MRPLCAVEDLVVGERERGQVTRRREERGAIATNQGVSDLGIQDVPRLLLEEEP